MNEYSAKKLGEVLAFARVGVDTYKKGGEALVSVLGIKKFDKIKKENKNQLLAIKKFMDDNKNIADIISQKSKDTSIKLIQMRNLYIGDAWNDGVELLEWFGFFEGAALVHWSLVEGASNIFSNTELNALAQNGISFHAEFLALAQSAIKEAIKDKHEFSIK